MRTAEVQARSCDHSERWSVARIVATLMMGLLLSTLWQEARAADLTKIDYAALPGNKVRVLFTFNQPPPRPIEFSIEDPPRIALDFQGADLALAQKFADVNLGTVRNVAVAQAQGRVRAVVSLARSMDYRTEVQGNTVAVVIGDGVERQAETVVAAAAPVPMANAGKAAASVAAKPVSGARSSSASAQKPVQSAPARVLSVAKADAPRAAVSVPAAGERPRIRSIDFKRGNSGEGRIVIETNRPDVRYDLNQKGDQLILSFKDTALVPGLSKRYEVTDFATPMTAFEVRPRGADTEISVSLTGDFEHMAYQTDDLIVLEARALTVREVDRKRKEQFTGEKLSLNFQDIEVRSVLQLLADFTDLNMVVSDSVHGNLTLRLKNVPWDQALDIILKTKGLDMRRNGNVLLVAPADEIASREKLELEGKKQFEELAPLHSEYMQVNYAHATDIATLLKSPENSFLTQRGSVTVDPRTNTLLVRDTDESLDQIRALITRLDIAVREVLIESRIVVANDDFTHELGARFGLTSNDRGNALTSTSKAGDRSRVVASGSLAAADSLLRTGDASLLNRLNVNLPITTPGGTFGLAFAKLPLGLLLDLEISAAQAESRAEVVSSPRVITSNQSKAVIKQGVQIPYQQASSSGATNVQFKDAVLALEVTPQITPDNRVMMDLKINQDTVGQLVNTGNGAQEPSIDTRSIETQVLVNNGQTVVLGGIYETNNNKSVTRVPFFGDLPLVGRLFRNDLLSTKKSELLIFITPKIVAESLAYE